MTSKPEQVPSWHKADWLAKMKLCRSDWPPELTVFTARKAWWKFSGKLTDLIEEYVPTRPRRLTNKLV
jgi:hypothetical protein